MASNLVATTSNALVTSRKARSPGAPRSVLVPLLVVRPGAPSSYLLLCLFDRRFRRILRHRVEGIAHFPGQNPLDLLGGH